MIAIKKNPTKQEQNLLFERNYIDSVSLQETVATIFNQVRRHGDKALRQFTNQFDGIEISSFLVTEQERENAAQFITRDLQAAIERAYKAITQFHETQRISTQKVHTFTGVTCWREERPISKVGIYVPGGSAPLFSTVLMLGVPAKIAKCDEIILCTPPNKQGEIHPAILYAANLVGVSRIVKLGGAQAIAALSIGTQQVPKVYKLFGPGNQYVTAAKQYAQQLGMAIDMPAGPSEVAIITNETSNASFVASDVLSQLEHGTDSQAIVFTTNANKAQQIKTEIEQQIKQLPRKEIAKKAIDNSTIIVFSSLEECFTSCNEYAPEHLLLALDSAEQYSNKISNAGSVFFGHYASESLGDYASGTNHTLPTNGFAKSFSGVSLSSFTKQITMQSVTKQGIEEIGPIVEQLAEAEQLFAHKQAVSIRLKSIIQ